MSIVKPHTLSGFMELLPGKQVQFDAMMEILRKQFSLYGFTPLDTPLMEAAGVLLAKGGGETEKQIYRLTRGDNELALRFDLTVPLAKYVALHYGVLSFPFRRFQIGKVYRGERAQRGRFREFYQADIDIIGDGSLDILNEAEIPGVIYHTIRALGLRDFVIRVNNRKVLGGLFAALEIAEQAESLMRTLDKLEKIGREKVTAILTDDLGIAPARCEALLDILTTTASGGDPILALEPYRGKNELLDAGMDELAAVTRHLADFDVPATHFAVDLTIARGLDYYTGTVYETILPAHPEIGSICSGGRYDNLAEYYTDKKLPGVGISIGLTRLFYVLAEQNYLNENALTSPTDVLILPMTDSPAPAIQLATTLRAAGIRTQIYGEPKKFKAKMNYANKLDIPFVIFLGEDELNAGQITIKNMQSGVQETIAPEQAIALIESVLKGRRAAPPISAD